MKKETVQNIAIVSLIIAASFYSGFNVGRSTSVAEQTPLNSPKPVFTRPSLFTHNHAQKSMQDDSEVYINGVIKIYRSSIAQHPKKHIYRKRLVDFLIDKKRFTQAKAELATYKTQPNLNRGQHAEIELRERRLKKLEKAHSKSAG